MRNLLKTGKGRLIAAAAVLLIAAAVFLASPGTLAFLSTSTEEKENVFEPGRVTGQITENVADDIKNSVKVQNTGNTDAYIRVAVIGNEINEAGQVIGPYDVSGYLAGEGWTEIDGFYYYNEPVAPGGLTSELLAESIPLTAEGHRYTVTVAAQLVQAEGTTASGIKAVTDAWGITPGE